MRMILMAVSFWLTMGFAWAEGVRLGMSRSQVEVELGRPTSAIEHGDRTILMYPNKGRVELIGGRVVEAAFVPIDHSAEPASPAPAQAPASASATVAPSSGPAPKTSTKPASAEEMSDKENAMPPESLRQLETAVENLSAEPVEPLAGFGAPEPGHFWIELAIGALVRVALAVVVLKLAFNWADVQADWLQMFVPALADTATRSAVTGAAYTLWHTDQLFYLDEALAYFALLFALVKTTHACTLGRAVAVAASAKVASVVVWSLVSVFVSRLVFG